MQTQADIEKLKYPTGKFVVPGGTDLDLVPSFIREMEILPASMEETIKAISPAQMNFCYRPGSWNIRQIVHHVADSHMNFHARLRLALTEDKPTVKPYDENLWAKLVDYDSDDLSSSLMIIMGVQKRSVEVLKNMRSTDFSREFHHPEHRKDFNLFWLLALYAWHGKHHVGQIKVALEHKF